VINACWVLAIIFAIGYGSIPGLLGILCLFVMDAVLELKAVRESLKTIATVFQVEVEPLTEERAEELTATILSRVQQEQLGRRSN
jgi:hypothetical protein